jgi:hypothetical protein
MAGQIVAGQIVDLCLLAPSASGTPYQLFARQWLIDHKPREQGDANAPEWRQLFAASAFTVLRTAPPNLTADDRPDAVVRPLPEHEPIPFERDGGERIHATRRQRHGDGWMAAMATPCFAHSSPLLAGR